MRDALDARAMVEGPNFYFGHGRAGTIDVLRQLTAAAGISWTWSSRWSRSGQIVSSSRVRRLIAEGDVDAGPAAAHRSLIAFAAWSCTAAGRGAKIGFGTANLNAIDTLLPAVGVYAGRGFVGNGVWPRRSTSGPIPRSARRH